MDFKAFPDIKRLDTARMVITQKIHGTNASVFIYEAEGGELKIRAGSRTRWIFPDADNYGFALWVENNKDELIAKLGVGLHFGEWAGSGINNGEGFDKGEKLFVLFDYWRYKDLPPGCVLVPVLYSGPVDTTKISEAMQDLKDNGSKLKPGFRRPEGVVVTIGSVRYKKVFDPEESSWQGGDPNKVKRGFVAKKDYNYLCQPIRLEKLLSRDEQYLVTYPQSLPQIIKAYMADLIKEDQILGDEDEIKATTKGSSSQIFVFIRTFISKKLNI